jgi:hypothetical protein
MRFPVRISGKQRTHTKSYVTEKNGTAGPARTGDPQIHNLVL